MLICYIVHLKLIRYYKLTILQLKKKSENKQKYKKEQKLCLNPFLHSSPIVFSYLIFYAHRAWQHQILNPLSKASQILPVGFVSTAATKGTSQFICSKCNSLRLLTPDSQSIPLPPPPPWQPQACPLQRILSKLGVQSDLGFERTTPVSVQKRDRGQSRSRGSGQDAVIIVQVRHDSGCPGWWQELQLFSYGSAHEE